MITICPICKTFKLTHSGRPNANVRVCEGCKKGEKK